MKKRVAISLFILILFILDLILILEGKTVKIDQTVYDALISLKSNTTTNIFKGITFLGSTLFISGITAGATLVMIIKKNIKLLTIPISSVAHVVFNQLIKHMIKRPRPSVVWLIEESGYSFPSGHAMISVIFYGTLIYLMNKLKFKYKNIITCIFIVLMLLIGASRIYLGVHYFTDIIGGYLLGLFVLMVLTILFDEIISFDKKKR